MVKRTKNNEFLKNCYFTTPLFLCTINCEKTQGKWLFINYPTIPKPSGKVVSEVPWGNKEGRVMFHAGKTQERKESGCQRRWDPHITRNENPKVTMKQKLHPEILRNLGENTGRTPNSSGWAKVPMAHDLSKGWVSEKERESSWKSLISITCQMFPKGKPQSLTHLHSSCLQSHSRQSPLEPDQFPVTYGKVQILSK